MHGLEAPQVAPRGLDEGEEPRLGFGRRRREPTDRDGESLRRASFSRTPVAPPSESYESNRPRRSRDAAGDASRSSTQRVSAAAAAARVSSRARTRATPSTPSGRTAARLARRAASSAVVRNARSATAGSTGRAPTPSRSFRSSLRRYAAVTSSAPAPALGGDGDGDDDDGETGTAAFRGGGVTDRRAAPAFLPRPPPHDRLDAVDRFDGDARPGTSCVDAEAADETLGADAGRRRPAAQQGTTRRQDDPCEKLRSEPSLREQPSFRRPVFVDARRHAVSIVDRGRPVFAPLPESHKMLSGGATRRSSSARGGR